MSQLVLGEEPKPRDCSWCAEPTHLWFQASPCCMACSKLTPKQRVTIWMQRVARGAR